MADIQGVRAFWNAHPLWTGESAREPGSVAFFEEHRAVYLGDCLGGAFDPRCLPPRDADADPRVLDLGCGIGFWTSEFARRGYRRLVAADLTPRALDMTRRRLAQLGAEAELREENAEALSFADGSFDHVNCQGVVHHTPDTARAVGEIARVTRPGGTASLSVYHRNAILRLWPLLRWLGRPLTWLGGGLKGRGREGIFLQPDVDEIVRLYDGADNPIGKSYTRTQFLALLEPHFEVECVYLHFFPARALPFRVPRALHRWLDRRLGFMIYANVRKPCAA
jgi:SAM-dependent methyltransferase